MRPRWSYGATAVKLHEPVKLHACFKNRQPHETAVKLHEPVKLHACFKNRQPHETAVKLHEPRKLTAQIPVLKETNRKLAGSKH